MKAIIKKILFFFKLYFPALRIKKYLFDNIQYKGEKEDFINKVTLLSKFVPNKGLCFDVGANVGQMTEVFIELGAKVIAIEPQKSCQKILQSKFANKIILVKEGLGERVEKKTLHISNSINISSFSEDWIKSVKNSGRFKDQSWNTQEIIQLTTLDELIAIYGTPDFCKIDVEGFELEVIKGLSRPIKFISFEYTVPERTDTIEKCIEHLNYIKEIKCNYCIGSETKLFFNEWIGANEMITHIKTEKFIKTSNGDIYITFLQRT